MKHIYSQNVSDVYEPNVEMKRFPDGDNYIRVLEINGVVGKRASVVHRLYPKQDSAIIQAILIAEALEGAASFELVAPYLPYSRQDKIWKPGEALSSRAIIKTLKKAGYDTIVTFDCHFLKEEGEFLCWGVKIKNISLADAIKEKARKISPDVVVLSPDQGAAYMSNGQGMVKERGDYIANGDQAYRTIAKMELKGNVDLRGKDVLIIDDMIATGSTIFKAIDNVRKAGADKIFVGTTHGFFFNNSLDRLKEEADALFVSNTVPNEVANINFVDYLNKPLEKK